MEQDNTYNTHQAEMSGNDTYYNRLADIEKRMQDIERLYAQCYPEEMMQYIERLYGEYYPEGIQKKKKVNALQEELQDYIKEMRKIRDHLEAQVHELRKEDSSLYSTIQVAEKNATSREETILKKVMYIKYTVICIIIYILIDVLFTYIL